MLYLDGSSLTVPDIARVYGRSTGVGGNRLIPLEDPAPAAPGDPALALLRSHASSLGPLRSLGVRGPRTRPTSGWSALTPTDAEVARQLSNPEIAQAMSLSRRTAAHHVSNVQAKVGDGVPVASHGGCGAPRPRSRLKQASTPAALPVDRVGRPIP